MKILWVIHGYPPILNAGAEFYAHNLNKFLITRGHSIIVLLPKKYSNYENSNIVYEDVTISIVDAKEEINKLIEWSDLIMTHLDFTNSVVTYIENRRPIVWVSHNTYFDSYKYLNNNVNVSIIYNSNGMYDISKKYFNNDSIVLRPSINLKIQENINHSQNNYITLINCNLNKGGHILEKIAKEMPEKKFLAITGGYAEQHLTFPKNVKILPHTKNIQEIYEQTRIILMPSYYESWGMVASEAMLNGIPVIANKTFGLEENLGVAGTYCSLDNIDQWKKSIRILDNEQIYDLKSKQSLKRAEQQYKINILQLRACENFLLNKIKEYI